MLQKKNIIDKESPDQGRHNNKYCAVSRLTIFSPRFSRVVKARRQSVRLRVSSSWSSSALSCTFVCSATGATAGDGTRVTVPPGSTGGTTLVASEGIVDVGVAVVVASVAAAAAEPRVERRVNRTGAGSGASTFSVAISSARLLAPPPPLRLLLLRSSTGAGGRVAHSTDGFLAAAVGTGRGESGFKGAVGRQRLRLRSRKDSDLTLSCPQVRQVR